MKVFEYFMNGKKQRAEFPDHMPDEQIMQILQGMKSPAEMRAPNMKEQQQSADAEELKRRNPLVDIPMDVLGGATFGFGDEIYGAARGLMENPFKEGFAERYKRTYSAARKAREFHQNPIIAGGAELAASLIPALGWVGRAAKGARSLAPTVLRSGATGAGVGGWSGYAQGQPGDRIAPAITGAGAGAALGTLLPAATGTVGRTVARKRTGATAPRSQRLAESKVDKLVDQATPEELEFLAQEPQALVADLTDKTQILGGAVARGSGESRQRMLDATVGRQYHQYKEIPDKVEKAIGSDMSREKVMNLLKVRKDRSDQLYDIANKGEPLVEMTEKIEKVLKSGAFRHKKVYREAVHRARQLEIPVSVGQGENKKYTLRFMHVIAEKWRQEIKAKRDPVIFGGARSDLQKELKKQHPKYKEAQDYFAKTQRMREAFDTGQELSGASKTSDELQDALSMLDKNKDRGTIVDKALRSGFSYGVRQQAKAALAPKGPPR